MASGVRREASGEARLSIRVAGLASCSPVSPGARPPNKCQQNNQILLKGGLRRRREETRRGRERFFEEFCTQVKESTPVFRLI